MNHTSKPHENNPQCFSAENGGLGVQLIFSSQEYQKTTKRYVVILEGHFVIAFHENI